MDIFGFGTNEMSGSPIGVPPFRAALQGELGDRSGTAKKVQVSLLSLMLLSGGCQLIDIIPFQKCPTGKIQEIKAGVSLAGLSIP